MSTEETIKTCTETYLCLDRLPRPVIAFVTIVLPFVAMAAVALAPLGVDDPIKYTLAVFICVAMLWTFGALPLAVTALLVPILLVFFGIFTPARALAPYADPVVFLLIGGLIIAEAFRVNGLDRRIAFKLVTMARGDIHLTFIAIMVVTAALSMWISNTATVALLLPVVLSIAGRAEGDGRKVTTLFLIGICMATAFGSMSTIIGSPVNAIAFGLLNKVVPWTFLDWILVGGSVSLSLLALVYLVLPRAIPPSSNGIDLVPIKKELREMGPLTPKEAVTLAVFLPTIALWVTGGWIAQALGLAPGVLSATVVALIAAFLLFATRAIEWGDARRISWEIFLIIGAGLAIGQALEASGTAAWFASSLTAITGGQSLLVMMLLIGFITVIIGTMLSNSATVSIMVPIVISVSSAMGFDPKYLVLVTAFCASISFITPVGTPTVTLAYSTGKFTRRELARAGVIITVPAVLLVVFIVYALISLGWN
ncbi:MAG: DASS family sodium-coupled anion symporter [Methanomassiliicoccus sp.]|nr:DASS family sodium-coupled anion symporter [Methanomassiliicoccus sp.]